MSRAKFTEGGYEDLSWVTPETWRAIGGSADNIYGQGFFFGTNEDMVMYQWQSTGEYPKGHPSQLSPRWSAHNVMLWFDPENGAMQIEFTHFGRSVLVRNPRKSRLQEKKDLPLNKVPTRRARADLLQWQHDLPRFYPDASWALAEKEWEILVDLYLLIIEEILDKLVQKREGVIDLANIDE